MLNPEGQIAKKKKFQLTKIHKYCLKSNDSPKDKTTKTKERFFSNAPRQNINIRQLLSNTIKKPIIITDTLQNDNLEIID